MADLPLLRRGKWTIRYTPPPPPSEPKPFVFTHDDFNGAPDLFDPRHGLGASIEECLRRIAQIEAAGVEHD